MHPSEEKRAEAGGTAPGAPRPGADKPPVDHRAPAADREGERPRDRDVFFRRHAPPTD